MKMHKSIMRFKNKCNSSKFWMIKEIRLESSRFKFKIMIIVLFNKEKLINNQNNKFKILNEI